MKMLEEHQIGRSPRELLLQLDGCFGQLDSGKEQGKRVGLTACPVVSWKSVMRRGMIGGNESTNEEVAQGMTLAECQKGRNDGAMAVESH